MNPITAQSLVSQSAPQSVLAKATATGRLGIHNKQVGDIIGTSEASISRSGRDVDSSRIEGKESSRFFSFGSTGPPKSSNQLSVTFVPITASP